MGGLAVTMAGEKRVDTYKVGTCKVDIQAPYVRNSTLSLQAERRCNLTYIAIPNGNNDGPAIGIISRN